ncbi:MAG TPA: AAA-like domain-containing protein [Blastocatellia bacterium]|nr:AAA-like domain-containing protein [Blastocatellia bacterium]
MVRQPMYLYEFGPFRLDVAERLLSRDGEAVPLPPKAFDLLLALVERQGRLLEKTELMKLVWPDTYVEEANLSYTISLIRKALGEGPDPQQFIETVPKYGYRFIAEVRREQAGGASSSGPATAYGAELEPVGGAMPLDSQLYITRPADEHFRAAIARRDSIVLIKGARQVGKTSLMARGLQQAREAGSRIVLTDLQMMNEADLASVETLFLALAELIAYRLDLGACPREKWDPLHSPNFNFELFLQRQALAASQPPIVWAIDEVDRLFTRPFASEVFGLFRSWHNARSLDPEGPWRRLTLVLAYATEAHLFITDLNQSPFNVGTRITLEDFTMEQVTDLNQRYGAPLREDGALRRYFRLVGGNPYLAQRGLHEMAQSGLALGELEALAARDDGPFGDHLRRILAAFTQDQTLRQAMIAVVDGAGCPTMESFYRLRSAGLVAGDSANDARPRCKLYADYLRDRL